MKQSVFGLLKPWIRVSFALAVVASITACYEEQGAQTQAETVYDVGAILADTSIDDSTRAERLAQIGEKLATPVSFMYADQVLNLALKFDAQNPRALIYKKLVAPQMELKGFYVRAEGLRGQFSRAAERSYDHEIEMLREIAKSNPALKFFLVEDQPALRVEDDVQELMGRIKSRYAEQRIYFAKQRETQLQLEPFRPHGETHDIFRDCRADAREPQGAYHLKYIQGECQWLNPTKFSLAMGDWESLRHIAAGLQVATSVAIAYDLSGSFQMEKFSTGKKRTSKQMIRRAMRLKYLGLLKDEKQMNLVRTMGADFYAGAEWVRRNQNTLCPAGFTLSGSRPGALFDKGLCESEVYGRQPLDVFFKFAQSILSGQNVDIMTRDNKAYVTELAEETEDATYSTQANLMIAFTRPIVDLKTVLPTQFDKCGRATNIGDGTVGGVLPNGDAQQVAEKLNLIGGICR